MYAGWCYLATYAVIVVLGLVLIALPRRKTT
jgi:hypothetical protein